jgi:hypothetical protein
MKPTAKPAKKGNGKKLQKATTLKNQRPLTVILG